MVSTRYITVLHCITVFINILKGKQFVGLKGGSDDNNIVLSTFEKVIHKIDNEQT